MDERAMNIGKDSSERLIVVFHESVVRRYLVARQNGVAGRRCPQSLLGTVKCTHSDEG
jgi:hypothetical protein